MEAVECVVCITMNLWPWLIHLDMLSFHRISRQTCCRLSGDFVFATKPMADESKFISGHDDWVPYLTIVWSCETRGLLSLFTRMISTRGHPKRREIRVKAAVIIINYLPALCRCHAASSACERGSNPCLKPSLSGGRESWVSERG